MCEKTLANLLTRLRGSTSAQHRDLDELITESQISESFESYLDYLRRFHTAYQQISLGWSWSSFDEAGLPEMNARRQRYDDLADDLKHMGVKVDPHRYEGEAPSDGLNSKSVGELYVLEGSIHGGTVILKSLRKHGHGDLPNKFLTGFGINNRLMWIQFCEWLNTLQQSAYCADEVICGAKEAFNIFTENFSE